MIGTAFKRADYDGRTYKICYSHSRAVIVGYADSTVFTYPKINRSSQGCNYSSL
jgi:hypothetical protein